MTSGTHPFLAKLEAMSREMKTLPRRLAPLAVGCIQTNMDGPFTPNATLTASLKNKGAKPLFDTGETRASLTYTTDDSSFTVGSPLPHARLINDGGTQTPKKAKTLIVPSTRALKRKVKAMGVRRVLEELEAAGWKIVWRPKSILGAPPVGASVQGIPLKPKPEDEGKGETKANGKTRKAKKKSRRLCLLFYRPMSVVIPKREFMTLSEEQQALLVQEARRAMENAR